ncbi:conjugal transfer trbl transmembrane protein [Pseudomonas aeruginosa WS394]|nr:conjugal transfer trbl transmembrane protein [Pseudomonas aeruginosa WS394]
MNDVTIIDRFLDTFSRYIDSGFGLLQGEVAFLTATLIVIDMTIAGLYWAMSHATGQGDDVIAKLLRKVLCVGAFAYIIGNFNWLASIVFRSFAGLGITATGSAITMENFLQPGRLAKTGIDAAAPILEQIGDMAGFPEVFVNIDPIVVLFIAWLVVILCFFVLAVQLFITLIEFKLTTLAGFVLIPFALWNKTSFLAEKVLGNVVSSGIKVLVLAVIVGIGSGLFAEFQVHPDEPSIDHALVVMLASLALLALGIFGPGIATGLVSGAPQLGAGAMAGAAVGAVGTGVAIGAAVTGVGGAVMAGARMAPAAASWPVPVRVPRLRRPAVPDRRSRPVPLRPAAVPRARRLASAMSPRLAHKPQAAASPLVLPLLGRRWPTPSALAGTAQKPAATVLAPARPQTAPQARRSKSNRPGPSGCTAASRLPMPRPLPPTRCAAATAAAPGKARACGIPIPNLQGEHPCDSNDRRCATPIRRSLPPRIKPPPRCGTTVSAPPACRRRIGA